jgi:hypothetical protein
VSQLCVNTLLATKVTLITDGIYFGTLREGHEIPGLNPVARSESLAAIFSCTDLI